MPRLIAFPGTADEKVFALRQGANTIGRSKDNQVFLLHRSLSREHARLWVEGEGATIEDLGSKNGTFVDGVRIDRETLPGVHYVKCGDVVFGFVPEGESLDQPKPSRAPTVVYDVGNDPARRSLDQMLVGGKGAATAIALRATSREDRVREKLEILLKVSELLSSPAAIDDVLSRILDLVFDILDVDRGGILMIGESGPEPRVTKTRSGSSASATFSSQIVGYVVQHGVAALFSDTRSDPRIDEGRSIIAQSICSSMCAPLKARDKLLGVLYVDNLSRPDRFGEEDIEFLSAFANQAAIAIDNAMLSSRLAEEAVSRNNLLRFFPPTAIEAIMGSGGSLGATETDATVLFSDISGFTALSSKLTPIEVIGLLNEYFPVMADIVFRHEGTLEKYIGDALLAVWGAPFAHEDDAVRAVRAAVDMQRAMGELNRRLKMPSELRIHVGINSGVVAAGNIGSHGYLQYATIGDATNVASRVCNVAREGEIVVDERTAARLGEAWQLEPLGLVPLKGKAQPVPLVRVGWR